MTDTKQVSLIEKIKKLFAIANRKTNNDGSSNENEAAAAMNMAQELLAKYNLDLAAITDTVKDKPGGAVSGPREKVKINRSAMYKWQQEFWRQLAELNYCFHWVTEIREEHPRRKGYYRRVKRHVILGSAANVAAVQVMGEYLTETIERLLPYDNKESLSNSALSWREGCAERLIERIKAKMESMKETGFKAEDGSTVTALAVRDMGAAEYVANYEAQHGAGSWARKLKQDADWEAGEEAREKAREKRYAELIAKQEAERAKETPRQRTKREEREKRAEERREQSYQRERWKEATRLDGAAYNAGRVTANKVGLDDQLKSKA